MSINLNQDQELQRLLKIAQENPNLLKAEYDKYLTKLKPLKSSDYLDPKFKLELDEEGGVTIEPDFGFVYKAYEKTKEKVFINVVNHPIIDEPEEKDFVEFENQSGIRIPMSIGVVKEDFDKNKNTCKVIDAILNPKVVEMSRKNKESLSFLYQLISTYINQKYKIELSENYTLPKLNYKGKSIEFQRVKGKKAPKIQTLDAKDQPESKSSSSRGNPLTTLAESGNATINKPEWTFFLHYDNDKIQEFDGLNEELEKVNKLVYQFEMPLIVTGKNIIIQLASDFIYIKNGKIYEIILKTFLPVVPESARAKFNLKSRILTLEIDKYIKKEEIIESEQEITNKDKMKAEPTVITMDNDMLFDIV